MGISKQSGAEILHRDRVLIVEQTRQEYVGHARNDWIMFLDPDEVLLVKAEAELRTLIN